MPQAIARTRPILSARNDHGMTVTASPTVASEMVSAASAAVTRGPGTSVATRPGWNKAGRRLPLPRRQDRPGSCRRRLTLSGDPPTPSDAAVRLRPFPGPAACWRRGQRALAYFEGRSTVLPPGGGPGWYQGPEPSPVQGPAIWAGWKSRWIRTGPTGRSAWPGVSPGAPPNPTRCVSSGNSCREKGLPCWPGWSARSGA